jgi:hypothetical protein
MSDKLAEMYVEITARLDKLEAGLAKVKKDTGDMASGFAAASTIMKTASAAVAIQIAQTLGKAIVDITISTAEWADEIMDVSEAYGLSTDQVQKFTYAEKLEGASKGKLIEMSKMMLINFEKEREAVSKATDETKDATGAFSRLGVTLEQFSAMNTYDQLDLVARKAAEIGVISQRVSFIREIFGKSGDIDLIMDWTNNMSKADEILKKVGFSEEQITKMGGMQESIGKINIYLDAMKIKFMEALGEENVEKIAEGIGKIAEALSNFLKKNPAFIEQVTGLVQSFLDLSQSILDIANAWNNLDPAIRGGLIRTFSMGTAGGFNFTPPPGTASGGIVTSPQVRMVGEAGPEAIIPLSQMGGMGGNSVTVNVGNYMGDEISKRALVRDIQRILNEETRRSTHKPTETNFYSVGGHL